MLGKLLLLALAGGLGTIGRFGLSALVSRWSEDGGFPWQPLAVKKLQALMSFSSR